MVMKKPDADQAVASTSTRSPMPNLILDPSIRGASFEQLLENRGIRFTHKRAVPCPNLRSLDDNTHDPNCPFCDNSGILRYGDRDITGVFQGNSLEKLFEQQGIWEIGSAIVTLPDTYDDGSEADFNTFDQLIIQDFEVRLWETKEFEPRTGNKQKLRYLISDSGIDHLSSIEAGVLREYTVGTDFNIVGGEIEWISGKEPGFDSVADLGSVFTVAYYAKPVYNVLQHMRELRVTQEHQSDGTKIARRLPQEILVRRDFLVNPTEKLASAE
jgi:hypothetical protein